MPTTNEILNLPLTHDIRIDIKEPFLDPIEKPYSFLIPPDRSATFEQKYDVDYIKFSGVRRYWMDKTNIMLSPYTLDREDDATSAQIVAALGPEYTLTNYDNFISDYDYLLTPGLCEILNLYFTLYVKEKLKLISAASSYTKNADNSTPWLIALEEHLTPLKVDAYLIQINNVIKGLASPRSIGGLMASLKTYREEGIITNDPDYPTVNGPFIAYPPTFKPLTMLPADLSPESSIRDISPLYELLRNFVDKAVSPENNWMTPAARLRDAEIESSIDNLKDFRDFTEDRQTVFNGASGKCIKRKESSPLVPFALQSKFKLLKGKPFTLRLNLVQPSEGQNGIYCRIELGAKLSLVISNKSITVCRRKDNLDLNYIREQEQKIDSYALMKNNGVVDINTSSLLIEDANYEVAMSNIQDLKTKVDSLKKDIEAKRDIWRQKNKVSKPTKIEKQNRQKEIREINKEITDIQRDKGFKGDDDKKLRDIERRIYTQMYNLQFFNQDLIDKPFQMTVIDYGCGVILFELDNQKDYDIFKDDKVINRTRKYAKTSSNTIKGFDGDTFEWLIGVPDPITKDAKIRLTGHGGAFSFAYSPISVNAKDLESRALARIHLFAGEKLYAPRGFFAGGATNCDFHNNKMQIEKVDAGQISLRHLNEKDAKKSADLTDINKENRNLGIPDDVVLNMTNPDEINITVEGNPFSNLRATTKPTLFKSPVDILFKCGQSPAIKLTGTTDHRRFESELWSLPLLFRGYLNFPAKANNKQRKVIYSLINECDTQSGFTNHIIEINPTFNAGKRRVVHQIELKFLHSSLDTDVTRGNNPNYFPKNLVGKTVDIYYDGKRLVTDGYITDEYREDLRSFPSLIAGLLRLKHKITTKITFNVSDILRLTEDQTVDEGLILEGYAIGDALEQLIVNSGIPKEKVSIPPFGETNNNIYISNVGYPGDFIPIAWPGTKLQYLCEKDSNRFSELTRISEEFGYEADGNKVLWVDYDGKIRFTKDTLFPIVKRYIPYKIFIERWKRDEIVYDEDLRVFKQNNQVIDFYFEPINMSLDMENYFSIMSVTGSPDSYTKERRYVSYVNPLAVADPEVNPMSGDYYLGHHKRKPNENKPYMKSNVELLRFLYYMITQQGFPRRVTKVKTRRDLFMLPTDKIIIEDHLGNATVMKLRNLEELDLKQDTMTMVLETLEPAIYSNLINR